MKVLSKRAKFWIFLLFLDKSVEKYPIKAHFFAGLLKFIKKVKIASCVNCLICGTLFLSKVIEITKRQRAMDFISRRCKGFQL